MKKIFGKFLVYIVFPLTIAALVGLSIFTGLLYLDGDKLVKKINEEYQTATGQNSNTKSLRVAKDRLADTLEMYKTEAEANKARITELEAKVSAGETEGYGTITGSILPFVTTTTGLNQYQRVCAQTIDNENVQFCVSVSAIEKDYELLVPNGEYYVFAKIQGDAEAEAYKAYYTEFVECNQKAEDRCSSSLSEKKIPVLVDPAQTVDNVDPADWQELQSSLQTGP